MPGYREKGPEINDRKDERMGGDRSNILFGRKSFTKEKPLFMTSSPLPTFGGVEETMTQTGFC